MRKTIILITILILSATCYGQEEIYSFEIGNNSTLNFKETESISVADIRSNQFAVITQKAKAINIVNYADDEGGGLGFELEESKFGKLLGGTMKNGKVYFLTANSGITKFLKVTVDLSTEEVSEMVLPLKMKSHRIVDYGSHEGIFYLIGIQKSSSILSLFVFDNEKEMKKIDIDLSANKYLFMPKRLLSEVVPPQHVPKSVYGSYILKMDGIQSSIEESSVKNKIYFEGNKIHLTFDDDTNTKVITVPLDTYEPVIKYFNHDQVGCTPTDAFNPKVKSYILDGKLFQLRVCRNELFFSMKDVENDEVLNEFRVKKGEAIGFKNTPFYQEGSVFSSKGTKELDTEEIIKRIYKDDFLGISATSSGGNIEVTIGGSRNFGGASGGVIPGSAIPTPGGGAVMTAPTFTPMMSYSNKRSTYFRSLFDRNTLSHVAGKIEEKGIEAVRNFLNDNEELKNVEVLKIGDEFVVGYSLNGRYVLKKFK